MLEHSLMCFVQHRPTPVTCLGSGGGGGGGGLGPGEAEADAELDQQEPGGAGRQGARQVEQLGTRLLLVAGQLTVMLSYYNCSGVKFPPLSL